MFDQPEPPTYHHSDGEKCGHLFATIITQAFHDLFAPQAINGDAEYTQYESMRLLTTTSGEWAAHRNWLCTQAGIDGDALAAKTRDMLSGKTSPCIKETRMAGAQAVLAFSQKQIETARTVYQQHIKPRHRPKSEPKPVEPKPAANPTPVPPPSQNTPLLDEWYANISAT